MRFILRRSSALLWLGLAVLPSSAAFAWELQDQLHPDGRPKQLWFPSMPTLAAASSIEDVAKTYIDGQASTLGLQDPKRQLRLVEKRESLLGTHLRYQQFNGDYPIEGAEIVISILKDLRIYEVFNSLQPIQNFQLLAKAKLTIDEAYDRAWAALGVSGQLFEAPKQRLVWRQTDRSLTAAYRIELSTTAPYGAWLIYVDAVQGTILAMSDNRISHRPKTKTQPILAKVALRDRREAFAKFQLASATTQPRSQLEAAAEGRARVFDPDPRTTLGIRELEDSSEAAAFRDAYLERELKDITFDGSSYQLKGPWVHIIDFDPPTAAPISSADGRWFAERGNAGFNDAMTYFHIDQSQRYIQSLGFKDQTGIQFGPIEADADGVNGEDNSYFLPGSNRLAFGHGCVDDNEDADVILHEYGHAIHNSINPSWSGGDTGAMGEGFGDYWAASYSLSTAQGSSYFPFEIYSWDGHGNSDSCWPGRVLNAMDTRYEQNRNYSAHMPIENGRQSDELWATPLFQSLLALKERGIPREQVDRIILQAQFGLGSSPKMRDMAQSIVASAGLLYEGPHAEVFRQNFLRHRILEEPTPDLALSGSTFQDSGSNAQIDPGETVELRLQLTNMGTLEADNVEMSLVSSDPSVEIVDGVSPYPVIGQGQSAANLTSLRFMVKADAACGSTIKLEARVSFNGTLSQVYPLEYHLGVADIFRVEAQPMKPIPDASSTGLVLPLAVDSAGKVSANFRVGVEIKHPYRGDLWVALRSPSGTQILLQNRSGFSADDLRGVYPVSLAPAEPLDKLMGEAHAGTWELLIKDQAATDVGSVQAWSLEDVNAYVCE